MVSGNEAREKIGSKILITKGTKMDTIDYIDEVVKYKNLSQHYKNLLSSIKRTIMLAASHDKKMEYHFSDALKALNDNGIKCIFDKE